MAERKVIGTLLDLMENSIQSLTNDQRPKTNVAAMPPFGRSSFVFGLHSKLRRREMRQYRWTIVLAALLLGACGSAPQAVDPTAAPTAASIPAATATPAAGGESPTAELFRAEPTARPTLAPTATAAPDATAAPAPTLQPTQAAQEEQPVQALASGPTRLVIDEIKLDYNPISVGLDENRVPIVLDHDVGWYNLSAGPGQGENIVMWGHVLRFRAKPDIPAPFARLKELKPGAKVVLYDQEGKAHNY